MHTAEFLQDLAIVMILAAIVTVAFRRLGQPVVLGYILAGVIIGPHTPPYAFIHNEEAINTLSELGVILLMFSLGLEFSLRKLKSVGLAALIAALTEILLLFWVGYEVGKFFDWNMMDRVFLGAMLSMSSTTVIVKVLSELGRMKEGFSQLVFGILILEDILGIAMIALLSGIAKSGTLKMADVALTLGELGLFLVVVLVAGLLFVPRLLAYVARWKSNEMLVVTALGLCFGVSLLALKFGYSVALGAFVIGAVVAESRHIHQIERLIEPVRDMFSAIFFVSIGLLIDPAMLVEHWKPILVITLAVVVGKIISCSFGAFVGGNDLKTSAHVGMSLAQIGEFSFIIAALGLSLKVTSDFLYPVAVAVSAITTLGTPYFIRNADRAADLFQKLAPRRLVKLLDLYTAWTGRLGGKTGGMQKSLMRKWGTELALNAALIAAVFLSAAYFGANPPGWMLDLGLSESWRNTLLWIAAAVASLPMGVVSARKLKAVGLLFAQSRVRKSDAGEATNAIRAVLASAVPIAGAVTMGVFILLLSSTILPPLRALIVLLALIGFVAWLAWRSFAKVYAHAGNAITSTFAEKPAAAEITERTRLLEDSNLATAVITENSPAAMRLIGETGLRSKTGATIVCLERSGKRLVNPGPDEEILPGDKLLLLGESTDILRAKNYLAGAAANEE